MMPPSSNVPGDRGCMYACVNRSVWLTVYSEVIRGNDELKAVLNGDLHVGNVLAVTVLVPVMEVLDHLFEDDATKETVSTEVLRRSNVLEQADVVC